MPSVPYKAKRMRSIPSEATRVPFIHRYSNSASIPIDVLFLPLQNM